MSKQGNHRKYFGFEVPDRMREAYEKAFGKYQFPISSAMREVLRKILQLPEEEKHQFVIESMMHDAEDALVTKGIVTEEDIVNK